MTKRFIALMVVAAVVFVVAVSAASLTRPAQAASISNSGPGSDNLIDIVSHNIIDQTNNTNIGVGNNSAQRCASGNAKVDGNTSAGNALSGNAACQNSASTSIVIGKGGGGGGVNALSAVPTKGAGGGGPTTRTLPVTGAEAPILPAALAGLASLGGGIAVLRRKFAV